MIMDYRRASRRRTVNSLRMKELSFATTHERNILRKREGVIRKRERRESDTRETEREKETERESVRVPRTGNKEAKKQSEVKEAKKQSKS